MIFPKKWPRGLWKVLKAWYLYLKKNMFYLKIFNFLEYLRNFTKLSISWINILNFHLQDVNNRNNSSLNLILKLIHFWKWIIIKATIETFSRKKYYFQPKMWSLISIWTRELLIFLENCWFRLWLVLWEFANIKKN